MTIRQILVDSGFLYELYDQSAANHLVVREFVNLTAAQLLIPEVVLTETAFLFRRAGGIPAQVAFLDAIVAARLDLIALELNDLARARDIMDFYQSARFDFVDCCIMALSERLNITQVCTLDRRDFSIFRPGHCPFLELLP